MTFARRLFSQKGLHLFTRNALASIITFVLDLVLIWLLVETLDAGRLLAVTIGFILANALHYLLARTWVFPGSERGILAGYLLFLGNAMLGLAIILGAFVLLSEAFAIPYILARIAASLMAGTVVFILNATLNFRKI